MTKRLSVPVAAALFALLAGAWPASAQESSQSVAAVEQCPQSGCSGSNGSLSKGDAAAGLIRVRVRSSRPLGHEWVRLEARLEDKSWVCLRHWKTDADQFAEWHEWDTARWPSSPGDCPSSASHGTLTYNGRYDLRVVVRDDLGETQTSALWAIKLVNNASTPAWASSPQPIGDTEGEPVVELRWNPNPEPDVAEYRYVRTDPNGTESEFAVSAARPGGQGCEREGTTYVCWDDYFPGEGYQGRYQYRLYAMRSAPSGSESCSLPPRGSCVRSPSSGLQSASLQAPPPPPVEEEPRARPRDDSPRGRDSGRSSARRTTAPAPRRTTPNTDYRDFFTGTYDEELPFEDRPILVTPPGSDPLPDSPVQDQPGTGSLASADFVARDDDAKRLWTSAAIGMLLLALAAHAGRLLRDR